MALWKNHPNTYKHRGFIDIPEGNHRVRICRVEVERFSRKRKCFEVTFEVSGYPGKLWHHLWYDPEKIVECEKSFYPFFRSFEIADSDLAKYKKWVGAGGAINIVYDHRMGEVEARSIRCIYGKHKDNLPPWRDVPNYEEWEFFKELPF